MEDSAPFVNKSFSPKKENRIEIKNIFITSEVLNCNF